MTPQWTNLQDLNLGEVITSTVWNNITGPDGNMAYLKNISDNFANTIFQKYTALGITGSFGYIIKSGWPQGLSTQAQMGSITYPTWGLNGLPVNQYITITGPAKYIAVLHLQVKSTQNINSEFSVLRTIISDTSGNVNLNVPVFNFSNSFATTDFSFQVPFVIDAPYDTDLIIGFCAQQDFQNSNSASLSGKVQFEVLPTLTYQKLPSLIAASEIIGSFILGTSAGNGKYVL